MSLDINFCHDILILGIAILVSDLIEISLEAPQGGQQPAGQLFEQWAAQHHPRQV